MASARAIRTESNDFTFPRTLRSPSSASDVLSSSGRSSAGGHPTSNTPPAYIATSAADQLASTELDRSVSISENGLELVNGFLDQILYNLLSLSKSTSLSSLRPSVVKLLKPRLGQIALNVADEELSELLEDEGFDALAGKNEKQFNPKDFDVELAWKLARLRCMVYARLGDVEEEDEEEFLEQERLSEHSQNPQMSSSPTSALFLASVLEFLGEQAICMSAQTAERKHNHNLSKKIQEDEEDGDATLVVEASDFLQLGREGPLSRLWRGWRRDTRGMDSSRPNTPGQVKSPILGDTSRSRKNSEAVIPEESPPAVPLTPRRIPLPMRERDVDEIEVPGLAPEIDGEQTDEPEYSETGKKRPSSMVVMTDASQFTPVAISTSAQEDVEDDTSRPSWSRTRSQSLPTPPRTNLRSSETNVHRDTTIYSPTEAQSIRDSLKQEGDEESKQGDHNSTSEEDTGNTAKHDNTKQGIVGGAIGAIAAALGVETLRQSRVKRESSNLGLGLSQPDAKVEQRQSVAEQMIGPSSMVKTHIDAETGANIRDFGDFTSMHVPPGTDTPDIPEPDQPGQDREASDPEDLALSSGDEGGVENHEPLLDDSAFDAGLVSRPTTAEQISAYRPSTATASSPISAASTPSSPRRNREASVIDHAVFPMREAEIEEELEEEPVQPEVKQKSTTSSKRHSVLPPTSTERPVSGAEQTSAWPAVVPVRRASREQQNLGVHSPSLSKSSQYSHQSKISSGGRPFVGGREEVRPGSLDQQRAMFNDPPAQSVHSRTTSGSRDLGQPSASTLAKRRERLRLSVDSDEETKIDEAKKKSLEILIKSDETLHYTLTPESARAIEFPQPGGKPKTQTQDLADFFRNTAPPGDNVRPGTSRSMKQTANGLRANPAMDTQATSPVDGIPTSQIDSTLSKQRNPLGEPRDARPERNTTRDLADYARSTGPNNEQQLPQALGMQTGSSSVKDRATAGGLGANGVPRAPTLGTPSVESNRSSGASSRPSNRLKFQARDARPARNVDTAELIDFIREGPPRQVGDHRIDRNVAPFRTTMDSDDLNALAPPPESYARDSVASTQDSTVTRSVQESTNSRTALLETQRNGMNNQPNGIRSVNGVARQTIPETSQEPPRKRRAPRDPYAIDESDDDFEEPVVKPQRQEESLIDFLRNTSPPANMAPKPILAAAQRAEESKERDLKRSASNSKLKDVLTRTTSQRNGSIAKSSAAGSLPPKPSSAAREESPHLTQVGSKMDKYRPTQTTHATHVDRNRATRPKAEARDAGRSGGGTADLADYLRNSGPPEPVQSQESRMAASKDQAGFMKFFQKRAASVRQ